MARTDGYDVDIFISYSRKDNATVGEEQGWVDAFHKYLENWLVKRRGLEGLKIWQDTERLGGNTNFDDAIGDRLQRTAIFFALNSPNWVASEYCQKELSWFRNFHAARPGGLQVGEEHRIFNILLNNLQPEQWPKPLLGAVGFPMHDASDDALGEYIFPSDPDWRNRLRKIVDAVVGTLGEFPKLNSASSDSDTEPAASDASEGIFVAAVSRELFPIRERLVADLMDRDATVLPSVPPPKSPAPHKKHVSKVLKQAKLSVHLVDENTGPLISGRKHQTYPWEQLNVAMDKHVPQLIWADPALDVASVENEKYRQFLEKLENGDREGKNYQFVRSTLVEFTEIVLQASEVSHGEANLGSILLDTHEKDQLFAFEVAGLLSKGGVNVQFNQESSDPSRSLENFENGVAAVNQLVLMFGEVGQGWLTGRIRKAVQIATNQFTAGAEQLLEGIWIYHLPHATDLPNLPRSFFQIKVLDNRDQPGIDPAVIAQLLTPQLGAE